MFEDDEDSETTGSDEEDDEQLGHAAVEGFVYLFVTSFFHP